MFDPGKKEYLKKLRTSIDWSERHMKPFRDKASEFDMNIRGQHWGSGRKTQAQNTIIVPYLFQAVDVLVRNLVPTRPACMITSAHPGLKAMALRFELAVNQVIHEIRDHVIQFNRVVEQPFNRDGHLLVFDGPRGRDSTLEHPQAQRISPSRCPSRLKGCSTTRLNWMT